MRIISGKLKGRIFKVPKSKLVRPTTDKTRESLFAYLENHIDFESLIVADLYAGSGSLGLEAISRGADRVDFVENNYSISKTLAQNIKSLNVEDQCDVFKLSASRFSNLSEHKKYDIIFADPPFYKYDIYNVIQNLLDNKFLSRDGSIVVERSVQTREKDINNMGQEPSRKIGDSLIYIFV